MIKTLQVEGHAVSVTNIPALLQQYCNRSAAFGCALKEAVRATRDGALKLLIYLDETTPGNPLNPVNGKNGT